MSLRFKVGEIAIYCNLIKRPWLNGTEVEVTRIGPFPVGTWTSDKSGINYFPVDYEVRLPNGETWFTLDRKLRKRPQPGIPESVRSWFEVKQGEPA